MRGRGSGALLLLDAQGGDGGKEGCSGPPTSEGRSPLASH